MDECNIKCILKVQGPPCHSYRGGGGRRVTHEGFFPQQQAATDSLPQAARARHASLPRGRLAVGEEGKVRKARVRHVSLAPDLRLESLEIGAKVAEETDSEALIGHCEDETKIIGRESLAKWKRQIERDDAVIHREILTPLSRLAEPTFEEESCNLFEVDDPLLQETHKSELGVQEQDKWVAGNEILECVDECEPLDVSWGNMGGEQQQVQMCLLMEEPKACLATSYVPMKLIGLNFCPEFLPIREEKFSVTVKNETEYGLTENAEVKFHTANVLEGNPGKVSEVRKDSEVWGGEGEVGRLEGVKSKGKIAKERKSFGDGRSDGVVGSEEGLCLGLVGQEITIARVAATITQMPGHLCFACC